MRPRDMAKIGHLILNQRNWNNEQVKVTKAIYAAGYGGEF